MKKRTRKQDQLTREYLFFIYNTPLTESPKIANAIPKQSKPVKKIYNKRKIHPIRKYKPITKIGFTLSYLKIVSEFNRGFFSAHKRADKKMRINCKYPNEFIIDRQRKKRYNTSLHMK